MSMICICYNVRIFNCIIPYTLFCVAPDEPIGLREITEQARTTSVYIEWDESPPTTCDGVTWYELSYTMDKTCTCSVTNITTNNTHYNLTELMEDATYYMTLVAVNAFRKSQSVKLVLNDNESEQVDYALFSLFISYTTYVAARFVEGLKCMFICGRYK